MAHYWVIGGEYADTSFRTLASGARLEQHGPFATYKEAFALWQMRAWKTVDDCNFRFRVLEGDEAGPHDGPSLIEGRPPLD